jgi:hypothetical protein
MFLILILWNKLVSDTFYFYSMVLKQIIPGIKNPFPKSGHKSNLFPWHKSVFWWHCIRVFTVVGFWQISIAKNYFVKFRLPWVTKKNSKDEYGYWRVGTSFFFG